ncbi:Uncharacterised protein [BD1-7 clade bacterium]|uniref:Uncharacterized protein n=1 Tax=BD1-7 clade bacterium TaxID=2029982 RepID=A0A5S9Q3Q1_9GAMM|nr:Uncharacterised protein [BD1-7 clade bacterium]
MEQQTLRMNAQNYRMAVATETTQEVMQRLIKRGITIRDVRITDSLPVIRVEYSTACDALNVVTSTRRPQFQRVVRAIEAGCAIEWNPAQTTN